MGWLLFAFVAVCAAIAFAFAAFRSVPRDEDIIERKLIETRRTPADEYFADVETFRRNGDL